MYISQEYTTISKAWGRKFMITDFERAPTLKAFVNILSIQ